MDELTRRFEQALQAAATQIRMNIPVFGTAFPLPCTEKDVYPTSINTDWTPGFTRASAGLPMRPPATRFSARRACNRRQILPAALL